MEISQRYIRYSGGSGPMHKSRVLNAINLHKKSSRLHYIKCLLRVRYKLCWYHDVVESRCRTKGNRRELAGRNVNSQFHVWVPIEEVLEVVEAPLYGQKKTPTNRIQTGNRKRANFGASIVR